ncbi:MAG: hypothetical protein PHY92_10585 [Alphaproteobacteria bacterium]|nr:hypothetical protein [Alphaproteobacteria bacterium]
MRLALFLFLLYALFGTTEVFAAAAEAREVARINNCPPKKIEVYQQTLGNEGKTIYRVECNLPKAKDENAVQTADALLVQCNGSLCSLLRPVESANK